MEVAHPQSGSLSTWILVELEFGNSGFWGEGETGVPGEKPLGAKERTNNKLNPNMASMWEFEPRPHIGGRRPLSPLYHPLLLLPCFFILLYMYKYMKYYWYICCGSILSLVWILFSFVSNSLSYIIRPKDKEK